MDHVPSEYWRGAFVVPPVAATELRRKLFSDDGGWRISRLRRARASRNRPRPRRKRRTEDEPRHPDLASGKPWPIFVSDPNVEDSG
ncbi:hypothetical protein [Sinorhizobium fredii]